jgi:hypothetical protein
MPWQRIARRLILALLLPPIVGAVVLAGMG